MIIFGSGSKRVSGSEQRLPHYCPRCGQQALSQVDVQRYFHLFFIPTLPMARTSVTVCAHCRGQLQHPSAKSAPLWAFSGAMALVAVFAVSVIGSVVHKAASHDSIATRQTIQLKKPASAK
jgi:hypothetical protein